MIDRTAEAVVLAWDGAAIPAPPAGLAAQRRRIEALSAACVDIAVVTGADRGAMDRRLRARPPGPGRLLLCVDNGTLLFEIGPDGPRLITSRDTEPDNRFGAVRTVLASLAQRGVGAGLILIIGADFGPDGRLLAPELSRSTVVSVGLEPDGVPPGVLHLGGGSATTLRLLDEQLHRRRARRVPAVDEDPAWTIRETGKDPLRHRVTETLFTLGAAGFATRGAVEEATFGSMPLVLADGVYDRGGPDQHLLACPGWSELVVSPSPEEDVRVLDLRTDVLVRQETSADRPVRSLRLMSATVHGAAGLRAEAAVGRLGPGAPLQPSPGALMTSGRLGDRHWARAPRRQWGRDRRRRGSGQVATDRFALSNGSPRTSRTITGSRRSPPRATCSTPRRHSDSTVC